MKEKDIEDWLYKNPESLRFAGIRRWIARQLSLPSGRLDLLGFSRMDGVDSLSVVEIKNNVPDERALLQVSRYAYDIQRVLEFLYPEIKVKKWVLFPKDFAKPSKETIITAESIDVGLIECARDFTEIEIAEWNNPIKFERIGWYEKLANSDTFFIDKHSEIVSLIDEVKSIFRNGD